jgi:hypothetical protein
MNRRIFHQNPEVCNAVLRLSGGDDGVATERRRRPNA